MFDAVMNYLFTKACIGFFAGEQEGQRFGHEDRVRLRAGAGGLDAPGFRLFARDAMLGLYDKAEVNDVQMNLLGSHDMARFASIAGGDATALRLATLFQMTYPGAPSIYYGDEVGLVGGHDPENRGAFPWHDPGSWDRDLLHEFQRLIALRRSNACLRRGDLAFCDTGGREELCAYVRRLGDESALVAINVGLEPITATLPVGGMLPEGATLEAAWTREAVVVGSGTVGPITIPGRSGRVYLATGDR